jgi:hypothetical protein
MTTIVYLDISSITNIEIQGRFIIIDDSSLGKLYFGFVDEYTARQILSELTYLLNNISLHNVECLGGFTLPMPLDILGPVVNWTSSVINSTATLFLDGYNNIITYQDLINALISSIIDDRDGMITPNQNMITVIALQYQNQTLCPPEFIPNTINQLGIYTMTVSVTDIAGNNTTISITLNVTLSEDVQGPELIFNDNYIIDSQPYTIIYLDNYPI